MRDVLAKFARRAKLRGPMNRLPPEFEPVVPDPRKLRLTAFILVAIMVVGGIVILKSYERWTVKNADDDRPRFYYRITKERDLRIMRQDGEVVDLWDLHGKVWVLQVKSIEQPERSGLTSEVMHRLSEAFESEPDFALVTLVLDPIPREELEETLAELRVETADRMQAAGIALRWVCGGGAAPVLDPLAMHSLRSIVREAVSNVIRHSGASRAEVTVRCEGNGLTVVVEDDGCGFAPDTVAAGNGLRNIRSRVERLGGTLELAGGGTGMRLAMRLPVSDRIGSK